MCADVIYGSSLVALDYLAMNSFVLPLPFPSTSGGDGTIPPDVLYAVNLLLCFAILHLLLTLMVMANILSGYIEVCLESEIYFEDQDSSIFRSFIQPCMWFLEEPSLFSVGRTAQSLTCFIMEKPHTGLDECQ